MAAWLGQTSAVVPSLEAASTSCFRLSPTIRWSSTISTHSIRTDRRYGVVVASIPDSPSGCQSGSLPPVAPAYESRQCWKNQFQTCSSATVPFDRHPDVCSVMLLPAQYSLVPDWCHSTSRPHTELLVWGLSGFENWSGRPDLNRRPPEPHIARRKGGDRLPPFLVWIIGEAMVEVKQMAGVTHSDGMCDLLTA